MIAGSRRAFSESKESGAHFNANETERLSMQERRDHVQHRFGRRKRICRISGGSVLSQKEEQLLCCGPREEEGAPVERRAACVIAVSRPCALLRLPFCVGSRSFSEIGEGER